MYFSQFSCDSTISVKMKIVKCRTYCILKIPSFIFPIMVEAERQKEFPYLFLYLSVGLFVYRLVCARPLTKRKPKKIQNLIHTHSQSQRPYLTFYFSLKSDPEGRLPWKTATSRGFQNIYLIAFFHFMFYLIGSMVLLFL